MSTDAKDVPRIILGTMTLGKQVDPKEEAPMVHRFIEAGHHELDTAYLYGDGKTEQVLGGILKDVDLTRVSIATKANPRIEGHFRPETLKKQLETSLERMGVDSVDLFYLHQPHPETPIEQTLEGAATLAERGLYRELGLSNYSAWETAHIWHLCREHGWPLPTVYQGMYNAITREVERELFPCLRALGMRFYAYNPLAGGMLTGKYSSIEDKPASWRFSGEMYRQRYWKENVFDALEAIAGASETNGISMVSAALRWMLHHSCMDGGQGDGVILGASSMRQLEENLRAVTEPELPPAVTEAYDRAWEIIRPVCPKYFRP